MRSVTDQVTISRTNDGSATVTITVENGAVDGESMSAVLSKAWMLLAEAISAQHAAAGDGSPEQGGHWWSG
jgi:archaellum component FlaF (FlaF/FlaG flagellin family)